MGRNRPGDCEGEGRHHGVSGALAGHGVGLSSLRLQLREARIIGRIARPSAEMPYEAAPFRWLWPRETRHHSSNRQSQPDPSRPDSAVPTNARAV